MHGRRFILRRASGEKPTLVYPGGSRRTLKIEGLAPVLPALVPGTQNDTEDEEITVSDTVKRTDHDLTHFPAYPKCPVCARAKMQRTLSRKQT